MRVLICVASRHRATEDLGTRLAAELKARLAGAELSLHIDVREAHQRIDVGNYGAAVVGSALYLGKWLPAARNFVAVNAEQLRAMPVWLFSSGPLGEPPTPAGEPEGIAELIRATVAREHRLFPGRLDKDALTFGERAIVRAVHAPYGDFRDWDALATWAASIADQLVAERSR
jgi:menaquinone-dependent protoporphyrinogen oxidase